MSEIIDYAQGTAMMLGSGYDLVQRTSKLSPLEQPPHKVTEGRGPDEFELSFIESSSRLSEFLDVGVEGSLDALMFKASAKAQFVSETQIDDYSLLFVVHARCVKNVEIVDQPRLNAQAKAVIAAGNLIGFRNSYGDHHVVALTRGGELFGSIRIETRSVSERETLRAQLSASGFGWQTRSQLESRLASIASTSAMHIHVRINGIAGYSAPTTVSQLFRLTEQFPTLVGQSGTPIKVELRPTGELPEVQQPSMAVDDATRYALLTLSNHYLDYTILANNIAFMLSAQGANRFDFDTVSRDTVQAQLAKVRAKMGELEKLSSQLLARQIAPNAPSVTGFEPAHVFDNELRLPNPIEEHSLPTWAIFPLTHNTKGDNEMAGHSPYVNLEAQLSCPTDRRSLLLKVDVRMSESQKDWTTFEDSKSDTVVDLKNTGLKIVDFRPGSGAIATQAGKDDHDWHWYAGTGLIARAECRSDVAGKETGKIGARAIEFRPVKIVLGPIEPRPPTTTLAPAVFKQRQMSLRTKWIRRPA
jgi:hypothetical protein